MKKILLVLLLISAFELHAQNTTKVLFIGNSITYFNNMPQTFEAIANSLGDSTEVTMYAPGGTGFVNHVNDPNVYSHFKQQNWDFIVLQPGSNESPGYSFPIQETFTRSKTLLDSIYKYNPCCKVLFYEISYGVWGNTPADLVTYNNTMTAIKTNLEYLADSSETFFAPVGEAFRTKWNNDQNDILWGGTGNIHPNSKGSYIAACTFYSSIFQKPSLGTSERSSLTAPEANEIQTLCDSLVLNHLSNWRINTYDQSTDFTFSLQSDTAAFINTSQNFDSLIWDFGDGSSSSELNPIHIFSTSGSFNVNLTTYKNGCSQGVQQLIQILPTSVINLKPNDWVIYPNPASDVLYIQNDSKLTYYYQIYNAQGQLILQSKNDVISLRQFDSGAYFIKRYTTNGLDIKRFIVR